jgi:hypothetical protein
LGGFAARSIHRFQEQEMSATEIAEEYERIKDRLYDIIPRTKYHWGRSEMTDREYFWHASALAAAVLWFRDNGFRFRWVRGLGGQWNCFAYSGRRYLHSARARNYAFGCNDRPGEDGSGLLLEAETALEMLLNHGFADDLFGDDGPPADGADQD